MGDDERDPVDREPGDRTGDGGGGPAATDPPASGRIPDPGPADDGPDDDGPDAHELPDEVEYPDAGAGTALPPRIEGWRRRSAAGAMLTGFALGLREVIEPDHREPAIVLETSGTPPRDLPVEADLESPSPHQSVVKIRRWLLHDTPEPPDPDVGEVAAEAPGRTTEIRRRDTTRASRRANRRAHRKGHRA